MPLVREALGGDASPSFCGVVFSRPGSPAQQWHIDSPHESDEHLPAHAVNVLLALEDVPLAAGPTEVAAVIRIARMNIIQGEQCVALISKISVRTGHAHPEQPPADALAVEGRPAVPDGE